MRNTAALFLTLSGAFAATVYEQPPVFNGSGNTGSIWTSHVDASISGWRSWDNFTLGAAAVINQATWYGVYFDDAGGGALTNGAQNTANWDISFFGDNAGAPGPLFSNTSVTGAQVTAEALGSGVFNGVTATVYRFTANLTPFNASAGTQYWFSPWSHAATFYPLFGWVQGTNGDSSTYQITLSNGTLGSSFVRTTDRAFALASVPEPATMASAVAGLALVARLKRRRK